MFKCDSRLLRSVVHLLVSLKLPKKGFRARKSNKQLGKLDMAIPVLKKMQKNKKVHKMIFTLSNDVLLI